MVSLLYEGLMVLEKFQQVGSILAFHLLQEVLDNGISDEEWVLLEVIANKEELY